MNITVEIKAPELANAILALAGALGGKTNLNASAVAENVQPVQTNHVPPVEQPKQPEAPIQAVTQQPVPTATPAVQEQTQQPPQAAPVAPPQAVPTATTSYSMDQLAVAATQLVDAGRRDELIQLLSSFGVQALTALPKEQYGAFATKLREMGAKI